MGKLAQIKTKETEASPEDFINTVKDETKRKDSSLIMNLMQKATKNKPKMWGSSIIGFGNKRFVSPNTGREVDWFVMGFSPRKAYVSLYLFMDGKKREAALKKLGKFKTAGGCININKLADVDMKILEGMISEAAKNK